MSQDYTGCLVDKPDKFRAAFGVLKLAHGTLFQLPNPLSGHLKDVSHLLECVVIAVSKSVTQLDDLALAPIQLFFQETMHTALQHFAAGSVCRFLLVVTREQLAQLAVFASAHGTMEARRSAVHTQNQPRFFHGCLGGPRGFLHRGFSTEFVK